MVCSWFEFHYEIVHKGNGDRFNFIIIIQLAQFC